MKMHWLLTVAFLAIVGCEKNRWQEVKALDTTVAYEKFVVDYPKSPFVPEARRRVLVKAWEAVSSLDTIAAYEDFLKKYPNGEFTVEATKRLALKQWEATSAVDTITAYEDYLRAHPGSVSVDEARRRIAAQEKEARAVAKGIKAAEDRAIRRDLTSAGRERLEKLYALSPKELGVLAELHRRGDARVQDAAVISRLVMAGANCLDESASWADRAGGRTVYDILKSSREPLVTGSLRRVIVTDINRKKVLFLAVKLGIPDSEKAINELLLSHGDKSMAEDYLNSGSSGLHEGGAAWARANGYSISSGMFGSHRVSWGSF